MSDNPPSETGRVLEPVPAPQPLTGLTGTLSAVYTELAGHTEPVTAAELALAAGLGRSTVTTALAALEKHGLAVRARGGHQGARRVPDRWLVAPASHTAAQLAEPTQSTKPQADTTTGSGHVPTRPELKQEDPTLSLDVPSGPEATSEDQAFAAPADQESPAPAPPTTVLAEKQRLAPGTLRQLVIDHLKSHPQEAFTATRISRALGKSSGAIANALVKIEANGLAVRVTVRPRTYRWVKPDPA